MRVMAPEATFARTVSLGRLAVTTYRVQMLSLVALAGAWVLYVFDGSQAGYCVAIASACLIAGSLAWRRDPVVVVFIVGVLVLLGPEARGALAPGNAPLGDARIFDLCLATGASAALVSWFRSLGQFSVTTFSLLLRRCSKALGHTSSILIAGVFVGWVTAVWLVEGAPFHSDTRTDVRLILIGMITVALVAAVKPGEPRALAAGLSAVGLLAAAKAIAISASGIWVIGTNDRLQASLRSEADSGVILVGGDTLFVLVPALAVLALGRNPSHIRWLMCGVSVLGAGSGLLISGTRTSYIVALVLLALVIGWRLWDRRVPLKGAMIGCTLLAACLVIIGYTGDVLDRLPTRDPPHVGVNFRVDEARTILALPTNDLLMGRGLGGRFEGKDVNGAPTLTGWSHTFPLWLLLKGGVVAAGCFALMGLMLIQTAVRRTRGDRAIEAVILGMVLTLGILLLSITLGRAALPEGVVVLVLGAAVVSLAPGEST
jgi:hypothetical protein